MIKADLISPDMARLYLPVAHLVDSQHFEISEQAAIYSGLTRTPLKTIKVRPQGAYFEVVSGFDSYLGYIKACPNRDIPVTVAAASDEEAVLDIFRYLENELEADPYQMAIAYRIVIKTLKWSIQKLANALGMARPSVSNRLRLLDVNAAVIRRLQMGLTTEAHIKAVAGLPKKEQLFWIKAAIAGDYDPRTHKSQSWSVKRLSDELRSKPKQNQPSIAKGSTASDKTSDVLNFEKTLERYFGTDIDISLNPAKRIGIRITLRYHSLGVLEGIIGRGKGERASFWSGWLDEEDQRRPFQTYTELAELMSRASHFGGFLVLNFVGMDDLSIWQADLIS